MRSFLLTTTYSLLTASGLTAISRWLHPAAFSPHIVPILLTLFAISAVIYLWRYE